MTCGDKANGIGGPGLVFNISYVDYLISIY
jgi:hypothetical protein